MGLFDILFHSTKNTAQNDQEINIKNDLDIHDITLYVLIFVICFVILLFYIRYKCKKLNKRIAAAAVRRV